MIISKTPLRMSFIGGGTDHLINERSYGSVIATSINKFIYLSLINNHEKSIKTLLMRVCSFFKNH